ncbi:MAG: hypothetical protein K0Q91_569 [Fibrobacteria bacterium]|jgi:hypothetical protein|nr:hypothetical protein [Fibrobacteria bacterium]
MIRTIGTRDLAERLIAYEARTSKPSKKTGPGTNFSPFEKLRPHLATLMGNAGFHALLARACTLAGPEVAWLREIKVEADGSLEGLGKLESRWGPKAITEGKIVLLAQLLGLLVAFIGEVLTLHLVREAWPKLPLDALDFGRGNKNET